MGWENTLSQDDNQGGAFSGAGSAANINLAAAIDSDISLREFQESFLGAQATAPTQTANGTAVSEGMTYFDTTLNVQRYYDGTTWQNGAPTSAEQVNINAVAADATDIGIVAGQITPTNNVATVAGKASELATLASKAAAIDTINTDIANINTVAGAIANVNSVADSTFQTNLTTIATGSGTNGTHLANINALSSTGSLSGLSNLSSVSNEIALLSGYGVQIAEVAADINQGVLNSHIIRVSNNQTNINTVAGDTTKINALGTTQAVADMNTITSTSGLIADINTVATNSTAVANLGAADAVADMAAINATGVLAKVTNVADNMTEISNLHTNMNAITGVDTVTTAITNVNTNMSSVTAVAGKATEIQRLGNSSVVGYLGNLGSSAMVGHITNVSGISGDVTSVASDISAVSTVAPSIGSVNTVATNIGSVNTVATDIAKVVAVANDLAETVSEIETVADDLNEASSEIDTVATNIVKVNAVGNDITKVITVADDLAAINNIYPYSTAINTVHTNITNVNSVGSNITAVNNVHSNMTDINSIHTNMSAVNDVKNNIVQVVAVSASMTSVETVADNITDVNTFANRYRIASSDPGSYNDAGDLYYNSTSNALRLYNGTAWQDVVFNTAGALFDTDFSSAGFMKTDGSGTYSVVSSIPLSGINFSSHSGGTPGINTNGNIRITKATPLVQLSNGSSVYWDVGQSSAGNFVVRPQVAAFDSTTEHLKIDNTGNATFKNGTFTHDSVGGYLHHDTGGKLSLKQVYDGIGGGGALEGQSSQGILGKVKFCQHQTGGTGGYIEISTTTAGGTNPTKAITILANQNVEFEESITVSGGSNTITDTKVGQWDTAYGWGDHGSAGYLTSVPAQSFASLTSKPTTIAGYGITDAYDDSDFDTRLGTKDTGDLAEGSNLYYTDARADARITNALKDEDDMASNSNTHVPSQQSVKAYVDAEVAGIVDSAPAALDTLNELAAALGDDPNFATTTATNIGTKLATADFTTTADNWVATKDTDDLSEGSSNLYYTDARADARITNAGSANWNTAYGWGNHASAGYLTSQTSHADVLVDGDFSSSGIMATNGSGTYSIVTNNSSNWDTAYGWGNHASAGYLTGITGQSLYSLSNVNSSSNPSDGQVLTWDNANSYWKPDTAASGGLNTAQVTAIAEEQAIAMAIALG